MLYSILRWLTLILAKTLFRLRVVGAERIPREGALIFAPNHVSFLDIPMLGAVTPRSLHFIGRSGLFKNPFIGWLYRHLNGIPLQNNHSPAGGLRPAIKLLRQGRCVVLYPEGRRSKSGTLQQAQPGVGMLASVGGVKVVPVFIEGTEKVLPVGSARIRFHPVTVYIGEPIEFSGKREESGEKDRYLEISRQVMEQITSLRDEASGLNERPGGSGSPLPKGGEQKSGKEETTKGRDK